MTSYTNPKNFKRNVKKGFINFDEIDNPIDAEIDDVESIRKSFQKTKLIPYANGKHGSSQGLLNFFNNSKEISSTMGACHFSVKSFAFSTKIGFRKKVNTNFDIDFGNLEIANETKKSYLDFLAQNVGLGETLHIDKLVNKCYDDFLGNGNYYLELILTETNGVKAAKIQFHKSENVLYWATKPNKPKVLVISKNWNFDFLTKSKPRFVPLYPNFSEDKTKTKRSIIHVKNGGNWYGRPSWIAAWMDAYREFQNNSYLIKTSAKNFTGQVFIEVEDSEDMPVIDNDEAIEQGFSNVSERAEYNFSADSENPQSVMITTRPYGSKAAFIHQFKPVTNENFFKTTKQIARLSIIENWHWSERLLGGAVSEGFSNDSFISELKTKEKSILPTVRRDIMLGINRAFNTISRYFEQTEFEKIDLYYKQHTFE